MPDDIDPNRDGGDDDDDDDDDKDGSVDGRSDNESVWRSDNNYDLRSLCFHIFDKVLSLWECTFSKLTRENLGQRVRSGQCWQ